MIFWFLPTDSFFKALPERYGHLEHIYNKVKAQKPADGNQNLIDYQLESWWQNQLLPEDTLVNGWKFFIRLTDEELEKIGIGRTENNGIQYAYRVPWGKITERFCYSCVEKRSLEIIEKNVRTLASERDRKIFFDSLFADQEPNQALKDAAKNYKTHQNNSVWR